MKLISDEEIDRLFAKYEEEDPLQGEDFCKIVAQAQLQSCEQGHQEILKKRWDMIEDYLISHCGFDPFNPDWQALKPKYLKEPK